MTGAFHSQHVNRVACVLGLARPAEARPEGVVESGAEDRRAGASVARQVGRHELGERPARGVALEQPDRAAVLVDVDLERRRARRESWHGPDVAAERDDPPGAGVGT